MTLVRGFNHLSFVVSDIERSVDWYCRHFGFVVQARQQQDNAYTRRLVGLPDAVLEVAMLRLPNQGGPQPSLELIQYLVPPGRSVRVAVNDVGAVHLAMEVGDLNETYAVLSEAGVAFQSPPIAIEHGVNRGGYTCYLADPDGNRLELHQPAPQANP